MPRWFFIFVLLAVFPIATYAQDTGTGYTVTYSKDGDKICPANSVMIVGTCYCASGYKVSGTSCVKDEPAPIAQNEIYQDILSAIGFNGDMSCAQLGIKMPTDLDMCQRYKATPADKRYQQWKPIQRPSTSGPAITNPWAPAGQQSLANVNASSSVPALEAPKPEKATSTVAETTNLVETTLPETTSEAPVSEPVKDLPPPKTLEDLEAEQKESLSKVPSAITIPPEELPLELQAASAANAFQDETIATTTNDSVDMETILSSLSVIPPTPPAAPTEKKEDAPTKTPSLFSRITHWLFPWL